MFQPVSVGEDSEFFAEPLKGRTIIKTVSGKVLEQKRGDHHTTVADVGRDGVLRISFQIWKFLNF